MCVGFWTLEHPRYALILCSNRDEYLSRPTSYAHWHTFEKGTEDTSQGAVLSGRDLRAGGTWLGINRYGDVAFLTNITEEARPYSSTRGELTSSFLLPDHQTQDLQDYIRDVVDRNTSYAGFNLVLFSPTVSPRNAASGQTWSYSSALVTNHGGGGKITSRPLSSAECHCGGLSNGIDGLDAQSWPKVEHGSQLFLDVLQQSQTPDIAETDLVERLFNLLTWKSQCPPRVRGELRNTIQIEPVQVPLPNSADGPTYGTRLSTVILVGHDGSALFVERDVWALNEDGHAVKADRTSEREFRFRLEVPPTR